MNFLHPDAATSIDCVGCKKCSSCIDAADWKGPMKMKSGTLTLSSEGLIVYGGSYWQETNITFSDEVYRAKNKFYEECRNVMNDRSLIE
jgi:hypothetical protein